MSDLFVEVFPIMIEQLPAMAAYHAQFSSDTQANGMRLAFRLGQKLAGNWVWADNLLLTDTPASSDQIDAALLAIQPHAGELLKNLLALEIITDWDATAAAAAGFMLHTAVAKMIPDLRQTLRGHGVRVQNGYIWREPLIQDCVVEGMPALAISVASFVLYEQDLHHYLAEQGSDQLNGLYVKHKTDATRTGQIKSVLGAIDTRREDLLNQCSSSDTERIILDAPHDAVVVRLLCDGQTEDALAATLNINLHASDYDRFGLNGRTVAKASTLSPKQGSHLVRLISEQLKSRGLIDNAYNSRRHSGLFRMIDFKPGLEYKGGRIRPYDVQQMGIDFTESGLYARHPRFEENAIRIATINTLDRIADDFIEALNRQLERGFGMQIEQIKARNVRVLSPDNLVSAVRVVEKENPHLVLAFLPDPDSHYDRYYDALKSQTLGKGIASHAIYESTVNDPNAMGMVIMAMMAKTGNIPYGLAEHLESANRVVGLDWVRESLTRGDRLVGMSRIYRNDGVFMTYVIDIHELESGERPPISILERLLPIPIVRGKSVLLHHQGAYTPALLDQLAVWANDNDATFYPIEIYSANTPHLYALRDNISAPSWGSIFVINDHEALVVSEDVNEDVTPEPLHIRVPLRNLPIEQAAYSILAYTLLHYGTIGSRHLPVTIRNADNLAGWLARGMLPQPSSVNVPFWL